jgi:hypothetical protein
MRGLHRHAFFPWKQSHGSETITLSSYQIFQKRTEILGFRCLFSEKQYSNWEIFSCIEPTAGESQIDRSSEKLVKKS